MVLDWPLAAPLTGSVAPGESSSSVAPRCYNKSILAPYLMETETARRPLKTRQAAWASRLAQVLVRARISPNAISIASIFFAAAAGAALYFSARVAGAGRVVRLVVAIAGIQGRLLCNMLDGMVAIEGGRQTKSGEIFNDLPDRIADALIFICAGYAAQARPFGVELGFVAAILAVFSAYVRMLGGA